MPQLPRPPKLPKRLAPTQKTTKKTMPRSKVDGSQKVFYINITIHDASDMIREKVSQKVSEKQAGLPGPQKFKDRVAKSVANSAAERVPPSKIAATMAEKMPLLLPLKMKKKGLTIVAEEVFREGPYFVLQVQVRHFDSIKMMQESQKEKDRESSHDDDDSSSIDTTELNEALEKESEEQEFDSGNVAYAGNSSSALANPQATGGLVGYLEWFLAWIGVANRNRIERDYLPRLIQNKLSTTMGDMLQQKYESKGIKTEAETLPEELQARCFYTNLKKVREEQTST